MESREGAVRSSSRESDRQMGSEETRGREPEARGGVGATARGALGIHTPSYTTASKWLGLEELHLLKVRTPEPPPHTLTLALALGPGSTLLFTLQQKRNQKGEEESGAASSELRRRPGGQRRTDLQGSSQVAVDRQALLQQDPEQKKTRDDTREEQQLDSEHLNQGGGQSDS